MFTLDDILNEWEKDAKLEITRLDVNSIETAKLHGKYLRLLSEFKLNLRRAENKQKELLKDKWLYYEGKMPIEDVEKRNWKHDPFDGLNITKAAKDYYYESDSDIQASEDRIVYIKTVIDTLKEIMDHLKWRHSNIKNIIDIRKFESGA